MSPPLSRWPVPEIEDLPEDLRQRILDVQAKAGFVPNVFLAFAYRPGEARAFFAWHDALLLKDTGTLTKAEREMIIDTRLLEARTLRDDFITFYDHQLTPTQQAIAREQMLKRGGLVSANSPEEFSAYLKAEIARWTKIARAANISID